MFPSFHSSVRGGNLFFSCEVEENSLMFASDFPHERQREEVDSDIDTLLAREDITDVQKNKILLHNAERFYPPPRSGESPAHEGGDE